MRYNQQSNSVKYAFLFVITAILILITTFRQCHIQKEGVYFITTVVDYRYGYWAKEKAIHEFTYNGTLYKGQFSVFYEDKKNTPIGTRYFVMFPPNDPEDRLLLEPVPTWFTSQPPAGGWKTLPTEKQMCTIMESQLLETMTKNILSPLN